MWNEGGGWVFGPSEEDDDDDDDAWSDPGRGGGPGCESDPTTGAEWESPADPPISSLETVGRMGALGVERWVEDEDDGEMMGDWGARGRFERSSSPNDVGIGRFSTEGGSAD